MKSLTLLILLTLSLYSRQTGDVSIGFSGMATGYTKTNGLGESSEIDSTFIQVMGMEVDSNLNLYTQNGGNIYINLNYVTANGNLSDSILYINDQNTSGKTSSSSYLSNNLSSSLGIQLQISKINFYAEGGFGYQFMRTSFINVYKEEYDFLYYKGEVGISYNISNTIGIGLYAEIDNIFNASIEEKYNSNTYNTVLKDTIRPTIGIPIILSFDDSFDFYINNEYQRIRFEAEKESTGESIQKSEFDLFRVSFGFLYTF